MPRRKLLKNKKVVSFWIEETDLLALKDLATRKRTSISGLLRMLIKNYLNGYAKELEQMIGMMEVTFLKDYQHFKIGSIAMLPASEAERLINVGIAKRGAGLA